MEERRKAITVELCMGSACFARGNKATVAGLRNYIAEAGLADRVQLRGSLCQGLCKEGPVAKINGVYHCGLDGDALVALVRSMMEEH